MNPTSPWKNLLPLLAGYAFFIFVGSLLFKVSGGYSASYTYTTFLPIVMLSGAWAVLGPGSYAIRTLYSIIAVLSVFSAGIVGFCLVLMTDGSLLDGPVPVYQFFLGVVGFGIPLICAAQLPYWLGRMIFGWQLIDESVPTEAKKIDIKELLTITAVIAASLVAATQTTSMTLRQANDVVEIGEHKSDWVVDPDTGEGNWQDVVVSEDNIDHYRKERSIRIAKQQQFGLAFMIGYAVFVAVAALLNIPCFCLGMMLKDAATGFWFAALYWLALFFLFFVFISIASGGAAEVISSALLYGIIPALFFAGAAAIPMLVIRSNGAKLVGRSYFRKQSENADLAEPKKVIDPFSD